MEEKKRFGLTKVPGYHVFRPFVVDQLLVGDYLMMIATVIDAPPIEARVGRKDGEEMCLKKLTDEIVKAITTTHKDSMHAHLRTPDQEEKFVAEARHQAELAKASR